MTSGVGAAWGAAGTDDHAPLRTSMKAEQQFAEAADGTERPGSGLGTYGADVDSKPSVTRA